MAEELETLLPEPRSHAPRSGKLELEAIRIAVFSGHSGGHLFPASAFAEKMRERFPASKLYLVTSSRGRKIVADKSLPFEGIFYLSPFPWRVSFSLELLRFPFKLIQGFRDTAAFLHKIRPHLAVGFGSYASFPGILLSKWKGIPTLIHEQNFDPGRATQWLSRYADFIASTFPNTLRLNSKQRAVQLGLPIRARLTAEAKEALHEKKQKTSGDVFDVLVMGGSQGSVRLNQVVLQAFSQLKPAEKKFFAVNHITGFHDEQWVREAWRRLGIQATVQAFTREMNQAYRKADMAITRAGANTLYELALFQIPALVIPYPYAGRHQSANAFYFHSRQAVIYQEEERLTPEWLLSEVCALRKDEAGRRRLSENIGKLAAPDAADALVSAAETLIRERL